MVKQVTPKSVTKVERPAEMPADWESADAAAMQALALGKANPDQQKRALNWIIWAAAGTYELDYRTDSRDHAFVSGRRFVGLQVIKMIKINLAKVGVQDNGTS